MSDWDKKREENPLVCQLCGEVDSTVDIFVGGFIGAAHHKCAEMANKGVEMYLRWLTMTPDALLYFAKELVEAHEK